jgi:hypothetical protein
VGMELAPDGSKARKPSTEPQRASMDVGGWVVVAVVLTAGLFVVPNPAVALAFGFYVVVMLAACALVVYVLYELISAC